VLEHGWKKESDLPPAVVYLKEIIDCWDTGRFTRVLDRNEPTLMLLAEGVARNGENASITRWASRTPPVRWIITPFISSAGRTHASHAMRYQHLSPERCGLGVPIRRFLRE